MGNPYPSVKEQYAKGQLLAAAAEFQAENPNAAADLAEYAERNAAKVPDVSIPSPQKRKRTPKCPSSLCGREYPLWRIESLFPMSGLVALVGDSGAGKSFVAIEMAAALAIGKPFFGLETEKSKVLYLVLEGAGDFQQRLEAWQIKWNRNFPTAPDFTFDDEPLNLFNIEEQEELLEEVPAGGVVFIDTMAQATAGQMDENSSKDMGILIAACNRIVREKNCLVVLIAHMGKDKNKGLRGHSSLRCALDAQIDVIRTAENNNIRSWRLSKSKASEDGRKAGFELVPVKVGENAKKQAVFSCYVQTTELPKGGRPASNMGGKVSSVTVNIAKAALLEAEQKGNAHGATWVEWVSAFHPMHNEQAKRESVEKHLREARNVLLEAGQIEKTELGTFRLLSVGA